MSGFVYGVPAIAVTTLADGTYGDIVVSSSGAVMDVGSGAIGTTELADAGVTLAKMANLATDHLIGRDTPGTGVPESIALATSLEFSGSGAIQRSALTGDVTASAASNATTIANNAVSNAKLRDSGALSVIGRSANSNGDPGDISATFDGDILRRAGTSLGFGTIPITSITELSAAPILVALAAIIGNGMSPGDMIYWDDGSGEWRLVDASGASDGDVLGFYHGLPTWKTPTSPVY